jgi:hypothetical protein
MAADRKQQITAEAAHVLDGLYGDEASRQGQLMLRL